MVRTGTRSGGARQPSRPVSRLVSSAISNVKKRLKAERAKAVLAKKREAEQNRRERELEARAKLRLSDAEVVGKLLAMGKCAVRFKMCGDGLLQGIIVRRLQVEPHFERVERVSHGKG